MLRKTEDGYPYEEFKYCECGCGSTIHKYDVNYKECFYIKGHNNRGKKWTEETKLKISKSRKGKRAGLFHHYFGKKRPELMGENNPNWVGDNFTTIEGIHYRIRQQKTKPEFCEMCGVVPPQELSNIDHKYSLLVRDYRDLCKRCHRDYDDNYIKNFKRFNDAKKRKE